MSSKSISITLLLYTETTTMTAFRCLRLVLLIDSLVTLVLGATPTRDNGKPFFLQRLLRPRAPETLADRAAQQAANLRERGLQAVEKRRGELQTKVEKLSEEINNATRRKTSALQKEALLQAETKRQEMERELERLTREAEQLVKQRAGDAEREARRALGQLETVATAEARRLAGAANHLTRQKASEAEQVAKRKLVSLEKTALEKITCFLDRSIYGKAPTKLLPASISDPTFKVLRIAVLLSSLGNLWGPEFVRDLWDTQGFGDEFFPWDASPVNKRMLAGALEFGGFLLLMAVEVRLQVAGAALIAFLFGRGACLNSKRQVWQMAVPGVVAAFAVTLLVNELVPAPESRKKGRG